MIVSQVRPVHWLTAVYARPTARTWELPSSRRSSLEPTKIIVREARTARVIA